MHRSGNIVKSSPPVQHLDTLTRSSRRRNMRSKHGDFRRSVIGLVVTGSLALMMGAALVTPLLPEVSAADASVNITGFTFVLHEINIYAGQTIQWTNNDGVPHTVASNDTPVSWLEVSIAAGGTGVLTLNTPGTFFYHCGLHPVSLHPGMWGVITVLDPSIPEFSSMAFVALGVLVMFIGIVVANRNR
jgi:plastocyanin